MNKTKLQKIIEIATIYMHEMYASDFEVGVVEHLNNNNVVVHFFQPITDTNMSVTVFGDGSGMKVGLTEFSSGMKTIDPWG